MYVCAHTLTTLVGASVFSASSVRDSVSRHFAPIVRLLGLPLRNLRFDILFIAHVAFETGEGTRILQHLVVYLAHEPPYSLHVPVIFTVVFDEDVVERAERC